MRSPESVIGFREHEPVTTPLSDDDLVDIVTQEARRVGEALGVTDGIGPGKSVQFMVQGVPVNVYLVIHGPKDSPKRYELGVTAPLDSTKFDLRSVLKSLGYQAGEIKRL
ncbi:MAG TPA: hypothetical protein VI934_03955 [Candidatus Nanoarchaeia archaeon]|nr:hypothetical protein [Candidatus Nanoarchaeia archaeon]